MMHPGQKLLEVFQQSPGGKTPFKTHVHISSGKCLRQNKDVYNILFALAHVTKLWMDVAGLQMRASERDQ